MRRLFLCVPVAAVLLVSGELPAQRGGSRDGGGSDNRGRQASRDMPTPSFSPPTRPNQSRPQTPGTRPSLIPESRPNRPGGGGNRPGLPDRPGGGNRPPVGGGDRPSLPDRPGGGNRPPVGGGNRPPVGGGNRPPVGGGNRPGLPDRPGGGNRPPVGGGNRPGLPDRPGSGGGNRPGFPDRPGIGDGIINRPNRPINRPIRPPNRPIFINNRPININTVRPGSRPWFDYHFHPWHRGYWGWWRPAGWFTGGVGAGWMLAPRAPTFVFNNPFHDRSTVVFNYSLPLPPPPEDPVNDPRSLDAAEWAIETFDRAREALARGDAKTALTLVDSAIKELPTDATLHEFRALCLFALKDYRRAAETLYAVLAAGPGWDWETMHALYPDATAYAEQLRALEAYQRANPTSPEASFVLAYHYLVLGHLDAAIRQLENAVKLLPESQLSSELLAALRAEASQQAPAPG